MMKKKIFCAFLLSGQFFLLMGQQKVTFKTGVLPQQKVSNIHLFLAGNFNGWNPADTTWELHPEGSGEYSLLKTLPTGIYNYKVTRGGWDKVECTASGTQMDNRSLSVLHDTSVILSIAGWQDNFAPQQKKHTASARVHILSGKFDIPQLGRQRRIWIYLPSGYFRSQKRYPVIYMQDGQNLFDAYTAGYGEWGIDEIMDKVPDARQSIIIGIDHGGDDRITEYDPYDSRYGKGRGRDYADFLANTLKPYVDKNYRTKAGPRYATVAGSSMGGLIAMYAALKYPDIFGNAGIFSPAFWIAPQIYDLAGQQQLPHSRFYFICGDAESDGEVADMQKMADIIHTKQIPAQQAPVVIIKGAAHNEKQWNGDFPGFYEWLMGRKCSQVFLKK